MKEFHGISASPGIAIGRVFLYMEDSMAVPKYTIEHDSIDTEISRYEEAVNKATSDLNQLKEQLTKEVAEENSRILDSHLLMLSDSMFNDQVFQRMKNDMINIEAALKSVIEDLVDKLNASRDLYLRERTVDILDVAKRIINHLMFRERLSLADINTEVILVSQNLMPSDTLLMNKRMVKGIAMDSGGRTSHTAILAKSFEIPAVLGLRELTKSINTNDLIIVDGHHGKVIINPDDDTRALYEKMLLEYQKRESELLNMNMLAAETKDGKLINLQANIEIPEEVDSVLVHGADGIGLYRSEFLFMQPGRVPSEEQQYEAYKTVLEAMEGKPVTIRTLDVGGDKFIPKVNNLAENNPLLGWRAIRFCIEHKEFFKQQLRALLRASVFGNLKIMFPMISGVEELEKALAILEETKDDLRKEKINFIERIPVGIMIEVPSAAMTSDILARKVDFFSIGTNDLIQYTIAVDRGNEKIATLYEPFHPGVLRLIRMVIENAHEQGLSVSMCGEMAGDLYSSVILLGLGLDVYSMSAISIPEIKRIIRSVSMSEAEELVGTIMAMKSFGDIDKYVRNWMEEKFDNIRY
ncbi:phosphoenolpyruvate--protein phosphotransferase [Spirochaeta isovalerica]|uniref:Phosphoenolpyruvate-protein phosphotransferase n=1 Tax=Spirochaeta isovalerica TaxID=150 RepID=A0A841RF52_9SPIO|nr:phosphoenolpyruvate--protein phosphotransferase [Spirochaeta isovalerica]MBB6482236.1 phosphotransferase system enzyme I (PtsI) [Spirochaeta isovalerica]